MQVSVEQTGDLERRLTVQVPAEEVDNQVEERLRSLSKRVKLAGFRPGKVPLKVVRSRYGDEVRREVVGEVMQRTFQQAVQQEALQPVGGPSLEPRAMEPGQALEYTATFEVYPEVAVRGLDQLQVEKPVAEITDADVDTVLERMQAQQATFEPVERGAQEGDQVRISYVGRIDGEPIDEGSGEDTTVVLGAGRFLEDIEKGLEGARAGEEKVIPVTFPDDHTNEAIAGKTAEFTVTVHEVAESKLPEVDDAFAQAYGITEGGVAKLREEVANSMRRELDQAVNKQVKQQVLDQLVAANEMEVPRAMVDQEIERLRGELAGQLQGQDPSGLPASLFEDQARRRVKLGLIMAEIIRANNLELDNDRVQQTIRSMASTYENPEQVEQWYHQNQQLMEGVEAMVMEEQVVEWLLGHAQVTEKPVSFDEAVNPSSSEQSEQS